MSETDTTGTAIGVVDHILLAAAIAARALDRIEQWEPAGPADALDVHTAATQLGVFARDILAAAGRHL